MTPNSPGTPGPVPPRPGARPDGEDSSALAWRDEASDSASVSREAARSRAEEDSTRELYARLINLLSQDGTARAEPVRKSPLDSVLAMIRRRWLPMALVLAVASLALSQVLKPGPPTFSATASMLLPPLASPGKGGPAIDDGSDTVALQYDTDAQLAIITAPRIVERAWSRMSRTPEDRALKARGWGEGAEKLRSVPIQATALTSPNIIDITVSSLSPNASKRLANIVGGVYKLDTYERTSQARSQDVDFVSRQAQEARKDLEAAQQALQQYKEKSGVNSAASAIAGSEQNIQQLQQAAEAAQTEAASGLGAQSITSDATLTALRQAADAARTRLETLGVDFQPTAPRVVKARAEYQQAQQAADARASSLLAALDRKAQTARAQLNAARSAAQSLPQVEAQLDKLTGNVERLNNTYNTISQRLGAANLALNAFIAVPTFLRPATLDGQPFGGRAKYLALSILGGLVIAAIVGLLLERADRGVHTLADLAQFVEAPILGSLPALPRGGEGRLSHMSASKGRANTEARLLEASYKLRSRLVAEAYKSGVRSVVITSPDKSSGKSLCAMNLAAALAFDGHRVLLVDTDFWNPAQHTLAEAALSPGYADVLARSAEVEAAMRASQVRNLWILPAGERPANVAELASGTRSKQQIQAFEQAFDFVILDSPPTLTLSDAQILSSLADAVALVVTDSTPCEDVQRAEAVLRLTGAHLLGVILNGDKSRGSSSASPPPSRAEAPSQPAPHLASAGRAPAALDSHHE